MASADAASLASKYTERPWSCGDFDEAECQQEILASLREQYNTIYDCTFLQPPAAAAGAMQQQHEGWLLAAYHSGDVRLFNWRQVCSKWLAGRRQQAEQLSWRAHSGPVYALALLQYEGAQLLATAGGDGCVRLWRVDDVLQAAAAVAEAAREAAAAAAAAGGHDAAMSCEDAACSSSGSRSVVQLQPTAEVLLPHLQNPLGLSFEGGQPAAQALAVDTRQQQLFMGGSDGGIHAWQLSRLAATAAALGGLKQSAAAAGAVALVGMAGHAAAVLGLDFCPARNLLASASEDGTVRVWDCATHACTQLLSPWQEAVLPLDNPQELLKCAKCPGATCVRFDDGGNWLLIGHADASLTLWNTMTSTSARHVECRSSSGGKVVPQVLVMTPGVTYVAGTDSRLYQFSFTLEEQQALDATPESVFGVALEPGSGMLAVCGSRGCLDLMSTAGQALGYILPPPSVLMPPQQVAAAAVNVTCVM